MGETRPIIALPHNMYTWYVNTNVATSLMKTDKKKELQHLRNCAKAHKTNGTHVFIDYTICNTCRATCLQRKIGIGDWFGTWCCTDACDSMANSLRIVSALRMHASAFRCPCIRYDHGTRYCVIVTRAMIMCLVSGIVINHRPSTA